MRDARACIAPADIEEPFARNRSFDKSIDPHRFRDIWPGDRKRAQIGHGIFSRAHSRERLDIVIRLIEEYLLQIDEIARNLKRDDCALAVGGQFLAVGIAVDQKRATLRPLPFADDVAGLFEYPSFERKPSNGIAIVGIKRVSRMQLAKNEVFRGASLTSLSA